MAELSSVQPRKSRRRSKSSLLSFGSDSGSLTSKEQLLCSVCLDVFTDPVSIPCGHNFCKSCITQCWKNSQDCYCPLCKEKFFNRPELKINTTLREITVLYLNKKRSLDKPEVLCNYCTGEKLKALKSCLNCSASYCKSHLESHNIIPGHKNHKLINPVQNLEDYMCQKHERPLELFCRDDKTCVCQFCSERHHKNHNTVPIEEESGEKKVNLGKIQTEVKQMIRDRVNKIQEIGYSVGLRKKSTEKEKSDSVEVFTALIRSIERSQAELLKLLEEKQKAVEKQAEGFIKELEQEIVILKKRANELEQLSHTEDHLHLLQIHSSMCNLPQTKSWSEVSINTELSMETVRKSLSQLQETVNEKLRETVSTELKRIQQYAVEVTLDPDTAHPSLILSEDGKQVKHGDKRQKLPDTPKRFDTCVDVLGKQGFSSGRFFYEVQVSGKTNWDLGVVRESTNRKGDITARPQNGFWTVGLRNGNEYKAFSDPSVILSLKEKVEKVGVFVDYEEGLVSFYDVENRSHIYSYTGQSFTEKLYPNFSPSTNEKGKNSAPLIICPVLLN